VDAAGVVQEPQPGIREPHAPGMPREQRLARLGFQEADLGRHGGLGEVQQPGCGGHLTLIRHHPKGFEAARIDGGRGGHGSYQLFL